MGNHALLSASSSYRWLNCPPSARLGENYEDKTSEYALEGTAAHSLCEYKLHKALGIHAEDPTENLSFYNEEMEQCANDYAAYISELVERIKKVCKDPIVLIEERLDFSKYVESGFGTGDCVIIADGTLHVIDINMDREASENGGITVAIGFRARKSNGTYKYYWLYRVIFGIPATNLATKGDSITFSTLSIEGTIYRRNKLDGQGKHPWKAEANEGDLSLPSNVISSWFTTVYEPDFTTGGEG